MITKKIIVGLLLFVVAAFGAKAFAHAHWSKEEKVQHITEKMARKLALSDEQKAKVYQINLARANGHEEAYKQGRKKEIIQQAVKNWEMALKEVLTPEQAQKLKIN